MNKQSIQFCGNNRSKPLRNSFANELRKKGAQLFSFSQGFFHCLGDAGRGVSGGKTVSCDQVANRQKCFCQYCTEETGAEFPDALLAGVKTRVFCL